MASSNSGLAASTSGPPDTATLPVGGPPAALLLLRRRKKKYKGRFAAIVARQAFAIDPRHGWDRKCCWFWCRIVGEGILTKK